MILPIDFREIILLLGVNSFFLLFTSEVLYSHFKGISISLNKKRLRVAAVFTSLIFLSIIALRIIVLMLNT